MDYLLVCDDETARLLQEALNGHKIKVVPKVESLGFQHPEGSPLREIKRDGTPTSQMDKHGHRR